MGSLRVMHVFYTKRTLSVPNCTEQSDRSAGLAASDRRIGGASSDPEGHALGYYVVGKRTRTFSYVDVRRTLAATSTRRLTPPDWTESHNTCGLCRRRAHPCRKRADTPSFGNGRA